MKNKKVLFIDGQLFQTVAIHRGMGKYSLNFLQTLLQQSHGYENIHILLTKNLPLSLTDKATLKAVLPKNTMWHSLDLEVPTNNSLDELGPLQAHNKSIINDKMGEFKIDSSEQPDFLILSLFIDQVCSVFPDEAKKILLFYDLIPLQYSGHYSTWPGYKNYLARFKTILEADKILTISQTVADDLVVNLGLNNEKICNIDGAPIIRQHLKSAKPKNFQPKNFVIMPTGEEFRKNNKRAIQGFEEFRKSNNQDMYLVVTSFFQTSTKKELSKISPNIIFTGNVSEEELQWLYENCKALSFVPEYEGLGLPILEAVSVNKPIVCSNLTVFNEMSTTAFYYANQFDVFSIADSLNQAIQNTALKTKLKEYPNIIKRYTWANTVEKAKQFIDKKDNTQKINNKPRIAILTPNPSGYSAIGKVVMQLHPQLSEYFDIDYYLEDSKTKTRGDFSRVSYLPYVANTYKADDFDTKRYADYDAVIYHVGNSEFHLNIVKNALYLPGYAIIHDTHADGLFKELKYYGYINEERFEAEKILDRTLKTKDTKMMTSIVNAQRGVITHSDYAKNAIKYILNDYIPVIKLNLPTGSPRMIKQRDHKQFNIGFAGIIHESKGVDILEEIINSQELLDTKINIFGIPAIPESALDRLYSYPNVTIYLEPSDFEFQTMLSQMDVVVSYRPKYNGETSLTIIEAMRFGTIPVVRKVGWFDELPDSCTLKATKPEDIVGLLTDIRTDINKRESMKQAVHEFVSEQFDYKQYAIGIYDMINADEKSDNKIVEALHNKKSLSTIKKLLN